MNMCLWVKHMPMANKKKIVLFLTQHMTINMMAYFFAVWLFHGYKKLTVYKNEIYTFFTLGTVMNKTKSIFSFLCYLLNRL